MVYLHFIMSLSKGQSQGHANYNGEYLVIGDRANITTADTGSRLLAFEWCIYI